MTTHVTRIHRTRTVHLHEMNEGGVFAMSLCGAKPGGASEVHVRFCAKCTRISNRILGVWLKSSEAKEKR